MMDRLALKNEGREPGINVNEFVRRKVESLPGFTERDTVFLLGIKRIIVKFFKRTLVDFRAGLTNVGRMVQLLAVLFDIHRTVLRALAAGRAFSFAGVIANPPKVTILSVDTAVAGSVVWLFLPYDTVSADFSRHGRFTFPDSFGNCSETVSRVQTGADDLPVFQGHML